MQNSAASHSDSIAPAGQRPLGWRLRIVTVGICLVWSVLLGRLVFLQWWGSPELAAKATRQHSVLETIPARPGDILDRHGRLLATTITTRSLYAVPCKVEDVWDFSLQLQQLLGTDADELFAKISAHHDKQFLWIKRRLTDEEVERVRQATWPEGVLGFREEYLRRYPQGKLAAHLIGLRDIDGRGHGGLEQSLHQLLTGTPGERKLIRDAHGRVIEIQEAVERAPQHGKNVRTTIDAVIQLHAERELEALVKEWQPHTACALVIEPQTGEVLAMASRPTFDPNSPGDAEEGSWTNTSISGIYEPGSTFKPFIIAWALQQGVIQTDEMFDCENGAYKMGRRTLHDHHPYGALSITDILVKSSNIGMAKIGERLTNEGIFQAATTFGFGRKTGIELPGELEGQLRPLQQWDSYSTGSVPMGQELAVTPLQLAMGHAALANNGRLTNPRLVLDIREQGTDQASAGTLPPSVISQTVQPDIARWVIEEPLTAVVARGTGRRAQLDDYTVFGKTGTAQKIDPETGIISNEKHISSFVCGAPAEDPRLIVLVVVDESQKPGEHYGGTVAAPTAAKILKQSLIYQRVPPKSAPLRAASARP